MRHLAHLVVGLALAAAALGARASDGGDPRLREDLMRLGHLRILFGHQSVGAGLVAGVQRLAAAGKVELPVTELRAPIGATPAGLAHAYVDRNGEPRLKLASFAGLLSQLPTPPDVALVKFCYADFDARTDVDGLFQAYQSTLQDLSRRYPQTRFVHVTVPIRAVQGGWKGALKRLLGRAPGGTVENARRDAFNERLRAAYAGPALFDLAKLEAIGANGKATAVRWGGRDIPAMPPENTIDGGHLARGAEDRIARALVAHLAALPGLAGR